MCALVCSVLCYSAINSCLLSWETPECTSTGFTVFLTHTRQTGNQIMPWEKIEPSHWEFNTRPCQRPRYWLSCCAKAVLMWLCGDKTRGNSASWHLAAGQQQSCLSEINFSFWWTCVYLSKYPPGSGFLCLLALCFTKITQATLNLAL